MALKVRNEGLGVTATGKVVGKSASRIAAWDERHLYFDLSTAERQVVETVRTVSVKFDVQVRSTSTN